MLQTDAFLSGKKRASHRSDDKRNIFILSRIVENDMPEFDTAYKMEVETVQAKEMAKIAYHALDEKKGEDIRIIDIAGISVLADYFIIANGSSESQVQAMVDNVEEEMHKAGYSLKQREGYGSGNWVLLDFGDVIVHVFDKENRLFYDLERIWRDGKNIEIAELS